MYSRHFSLREAPFSITPDTAFFYPHEGAQAALNMLLVALRSGEGFLKIVGEVGCGKTVLCRQLLKMLHGEYVTAYIPNPDMGPDDLLMALAHDWEASLAAAQEGARQGEPRMAQLGREVDGLAQGDDAIERGSRHRLLRLPRLQLRLSPSTPPGCSRP